MSERLGEMLIKAGLISQKQLQEALQLQKTNGGKLGYNLVRLGHVKEEDITSLLSEQYGVPAIHLEHFEIDESILKHIPSDVAQKYLVIPIERTGATLTVAMADPSNVFALDDIRFITGYQVEPVVAAEASIREAIGRYYGSTHELQLKEIMDEIAKEEVADLEVEDEEGQISAEDLEQASQDAPVVKLCNLIMTDAVRKGASDIHVEPYEKDFRVRFRIDGVLYEQLRPPMKLREAIASRLKILAKLDISEKRLPQDGRIKMRMKLDNKTKEIDYRVSTVPCLHGEKIVMRLLDKEGLKLDLTKLGFEEESMQKFERAIMKPYGMVLVTGPTGSGKTNTLYSAVGQLNKPETNIMTAEDPVEFNIEGCNQVQMKEAIGLNFASALRAFLRQDPNIILVGEIRDFETAEIAVKAALTGHLVLSTLHTNDAPSTISRLMNMGIEPFLVATSVHLIQAQRLVRRICKECKEEFKLPRKALQDLGYSDEEVDTVKVYKGRGCPTCNNSGYKGRVALMEVMEMSEQLREMVLMGANAVELKRQALQEGMITLRRSGLVKISNGVTTIEEVVRETVS
ncbi:MAG: type IV-A pilus assembly ATPase PilB [Acidobacteriota bacterium]